MGKTSAFNSRAISVVLVLVVVTVSAIGGAYLESIKPSSGQVSVSGTGTVQATPDTATFQIGVTTNSSTVSSALHTNNAKVSLLESVLRRDGITKANVQTSGLNVNPVTNNAGTTTGYQVSNTVTVVSHQLSSLGSVLSDAITAVGNDAVVSGISFSVSNPSHVLTQARNQALQSALREAQALASAGHTSVGKILRVSENDQSSGTSPVAFTAMSTARTSVPIESGSETETVQVNVTYQLNN